MNKIHIKKISEVDKKKLIEFYSKSFHYEKSLLEDYNWRYRAGYNNYEPLVLVIDDNICGHAGLIPINIKINKKKETAIWFTDFFINSKYRQKGYGKLLAEEWMKICPIQITICNDQSLKIFNKLNWSSNQKFIRRIKFNNYLKIIPIFRKIKNYDLISDNLDSLKLMDLNNSSIDKIIKLDERELLKKSSGIIRDEEWFKWRLIDCPHRDKIYIFQFNDSMIITHLKLKNNLKVLNIIYSSIPISKNLIKTLSKFSKKNAIDYLAYVSDQHTIFDKIMPWQRRLNFAFHSKEKSISNALNENFNNLQLIDSDVDYL